MRNGTRSNADIIVVMRQTVGNEEAGGGGLYDGRLAYDTEYLGVWY